MESAPVTPAESSPTPPPPPTFRLPIYEIRGSATLKDPGGRGKVKASEAPLPFIQALVAKHAAIQKKKGHEERAYQEYPPFHWGDRFQTLVYFSKHTHPSPFGKALDKAAAADLGAAVLRPDVTGKEVIHHVCFLWETGPALNKRLYALASGKGWKLIHAYCEYNFPIQIARMLVKARFNLFDHTLLAGAKQASSEYYKHEQEYALAQHELHSAWRIMKTAVSSFKETSSIYGLQAFQQYADRTISVELGVGRLLIQREFSMEEYQELIAHFSTILGGGRTWTTDGQQETPDPAFRYLNNIERVFNSELKRKLDRKLGVRFYDIYRGACLQRPAICHRRYSDYVHSPSFVLSMGGEDITAFYSPPSFDEIHHHLVETLGQGLAQGPFLKALDQIEMRFCFGNEKHKLLTYVHTELEHDGQLYFRLDGAYFMVKFEQTLLLWRAFYRMKEELLMGPADPAALTIPWVAKRSWCAFSFDAICQELKLDTYNELDKIEGAKFSFLDASGRVLIRKLTPAFWEGFGKQEAKEVQRHARLLEQLLEETHITKRDLEVALEKAGRKTEEAAKLAATIHKQLLEPHDLVWSAKKTAETVTPIAEDDAVLFTDLESLPGIRNSKSKHLSKTSTVADLSNYLRATKRAGQRVSAHGLKTVMKSGAKSGAGKTVLGLLKKPFEVKPPHMVVQGPPPSTLALDPRLAQRLTEEYGRFLEVVDEGAYNERYLDRPNFFVFDRVYAHGSKKIELFDILSYAVPGHLYLYHVKRSFAGPTRDACSQIRNAALELGGADAMKTLASLYDMAVNTSSKGAYQQALKRKLETLGKGNFLQLFQQGTSNSRKITFVYAFLDDHAQEQRLKDDPNPDEPFKEEYFPRSPAATLPRLVQSGYLDGEAKINRKGILAAEKDFVQDFGDPEGKVIYRAFSAHTSHYDSVVARVELLQLREEFTGFDFKICQIPREGAVSSRSSASAPIRMPATLPRPLMQPIDDLMDVSTPTLTPPSSASPGQGTNSNLANGTPPSITAARAPPTLSRDAPSSANQSPQDLSGQATPAGTAPQKRPLNLMERWLASSQEPNKKQRTQE